MNKLTYRRGIAAFSGLALAAASLSVTTALAAPTGDVADADAVQPETNVPVGLQLDDNFEPLDGSVDVDIIDGEVARDNPGAASWIGTKKDGGLVPICTATVIAKQYVLTATHCVVDSVPDSDRYRVRVNSLNNGSGGEIFEVESWKTKYDVRVAKLKTPIPNPKIVKLAKSDPPNGSTNQIYGWGATKPGNDSPVSPVLKMANVKVTSLNGRDYKGGPAINSTGISGNAWKGDSGGPQFYNGEQVGVASTAATQNKTQTYSSVAKNYDFIMSSMDGGDAPAPTPTPEPEPTPTPTPTPDVPDMENPADFPLNDYETVISEVKSTVASASKATVTVDINHACSQNLRIYLNGPGGQRYLLKRSSYTFNCKQWQGAQTLSVDVSGNASGVWSLEVMDSYSGGTGTFNGWKLALS